MKEEKELTMHVKKCSYAGFPRSVRDIIEAAHNFASCFYHVLYSSTNEEKVRSAFKVCGLCAYNVENINLKKIMETPKKRQHQGSDPLVKAVPENMAIPDMIDM